MQAKTHWEQRCQVLEEAVIRLANIVAKTLPPALVEDISWWSREWDMNIRRLPDDDAKQTDGE